MSKNSYIPIISGYKTTVLYNCGSNESEGRYIIGSLTKGNTTTNNEDLATTTFEQNLETGECSDSTLFLNYPAGSSGNLCNSQSNETLTTIDSNITVIAVSNIPSSVSAAITDSEEVQPISDDIDLDNQNRQPILRDNFESLSDGNDNIDSDVDIPEEDALQSSIIYRGVTANNRAVIDGLKASCDDGEATISSKDVYFVKNTQASENEQYQIATEDINVKDENVNVTDTKLESIDINDVHISEKDNDNTTIDRTTSVAFSEQICTLSAVTSAFSTEAVTDFNNATNCKPETSENIVDLNCSDRRDNIAETDNVNKEDNNKELETGPSNNYSSLNESSQYTLSHEKADKYVPLVRTISLVDDVIPEECEHDLEEEKPIIVTTKTESEIYKPDAKDKDIKESDNVSYDIHQEKKQQNYRNEEFIAKQVVDEALLSGITDAMEVMRKNACNVALDAELNKTKRLTIGPNQCEQKTIQLTENENKENVAESSINPTLSQKLLPESTTTTTTTVEETEEELVQSLACLMDEYRNLTSPSINALRNINITTSDLRHYNPLIPVDDNGKISTFTTTTKITTTTMNENSTNLRSDPEHRRSDYITTKDPKLENYNYNVNVNIENVSNNKHYQQQEQQQQPLYPQRQQLYSPQLQRKFQNSDALTISTNCNKSPTPTFGSLHRQNLLQNKYQMPSASLSPRTLSRINHLNVIMDTKSDEDGGEVIHNHPVFMKDTSKYWYKPTISREEAINMLKQKPPGTFVVRDSNSFPGAFGLALKVSRPPAGVITSTDINGDSSAELVRHFLIEPSPKGVKLKGCSNEPVFGTLAALVYQHSITPLALPCKLLLPEYDPALSANEQQQHLNSNQALLERGAACNVTYLCSFDTESLTGPEALRRATAFGLEDLVNGALRAIPVHFKVSAQGITLTDNTRSLFFRRHYPAHLITFAGIDPESRVFDNNNCCQLPPSYVRQAPIFGFVARKFMSGVGSGENACHVFAELDPEQPASAVVRFITNVMMPQAHARQQTPHLQR